MIYFEHFLYYCLTRINAWNNICLFEYRDERSYIFIQKIIQ